MYLRKGHSKEASHPETCELGTHCFSKVATSCSVKTNKQTSKLTSPILSRKPFFVGVGKKFSSPKIIEKLEGFVFVGVISDVTLGAQNPLGMYLHG
uniref:Uncharacterized protein n=1 Tax=Panagrellus redivivus TaxID=6233 RepID=A0A7E4W8J3_PANRE